MEDNTDNHTCHLWKQFPGLRNHSWKHYRVDSATSNYPNMLEALEFMQRFLARCGNSMVTSCI